MGTAAFDPNISFLNFSPAFRDLVGSPKEPSPKEMQNFADFQLQVFPPPNPVRSLDNSLSPAQANGRASILERGRRTV